MAVARLTVSQAFDRFYLKARSPRSRTEKEYRYKLARWERMAKAPSIDEATAERFDEFRKAAQKERFKPETIEATVGTVLQVLRRCVVVGELAELPERGNRLKLDSPLRYVPPVEDLGRMYAASDVAKWPLWSKTPGAFWRPLFCVAYWTSLRHFDLFWTLRDACLSRSTMVVISNKTGKEHVFPRHPVLDRHIRQASRRRGDDRIFPIGICRKQVLRELHRIAEAAKVPAFTLHAIRRLSCSEWQDAAWGAGEVIQGSAIRGSASRYIVPRILKQAAPLLRWPAEMLTPAERDEQANDERRLMQAVQRLTKSDRSIVIHLAEKLAS